MDFSAVAMVVLPLEVGPERAMRKGGEGEVEEDISCELSEGWFDGKKHVIACPTR